MFVSRKNTSMGQRGLACTLMSQRPDSLSRLSHDSTALHPYKGGPTERARVLYCFSDVYS